LFYYLPPVAAEYYHVATEHLLNKIKLNLVVSNSFINFTSSIKRKGNKKKKKRTKINLVDTKNSFIFVF